MRGRLWAVAGLLAGCLSTAPALAQDDDLDFLFEPYDAESESTAQESSEPDRNQNPEPAGESAEDAASTDDRDEPVATIPVRSEQADTPPLRAPRRQIEEIIVTAQKTEQSLSDVPVSVTSLQGKFLVENAVGTLTEASTYVPNVRVESTSPTSPQVFIRGFGTNTFNPSFEPSVGLVQDDIFYARGSYFTQSMFDLARIEVLRGPQGTLFGKNTIAGVFNIVTRGAPDEGTEVDLRYQRTEWNDDRIEGGIGARLNDDWGARVAILEERRHGRLYNTLVQRFEDEVNQSAQRLRLDYEGTSPLTMGLVVQNTATKVNFWPRQLFQIDPDTEAYLSGFDPQIEGNPLDFQTSFNIPGWMHIDSWTAGGNGSYDFGQVFGLDGLETTVVVASSFMGINQFQDLDTSPADLINLFGDKEDYDQHSFEWRFTGCGGAPFGWGSGSEFVAGVYGLEATYHIITGIEAGEDLASYALTDSGQRLISGGSSSGLPFGGAAGALGPVLGPLIAAGIGQDRYTFDYQQRNRTFAAFGQLTWNINTQWSITPGLRFNNEQKRITSIGVSSCPSKSATQDCLVQTIVSANDYEVDIHRRESNISPKLSAMYHHHDDLRVFATWSRGFKSGGANAISFTGEDLEYEPEIATSTELGIKSHWFDRTLSINATAYRMDFDDLQVLAFNGVFFDVSNAGAAYSTGLELDSQWLTPYEPLTLNTSLGYLEAKYKRYDNAPAPVSEGLNERQDLAGKTLAFAPKWSATVSPMLEYSLFGLDLNLGFNIRYQDDQFTDTDLDEYTRVKAHTIYSAHLRVSPYAGHWNLVIGAKNLTDKRVLNQSLDTALFPGVYLVNQQPGRTLYAGIGLDF